MTDHDIRARLDRLERAHCRTTRLASLLALLLAGTVVAAMDNGEVAEVIRAKKFEVISEAGAAVAMLDSNQRGAGQLKTLTHEGHPAVFLLAEGGYGGIAVYDHEQRFGTVIDGPWIWTHSDGEVVTGIGKSPAGAGSLVLYDSLHQVRVTAGVNEDGSGAVFVTDSDGRVRMLRAGE